MGWLVSTPLSLAVLAELPAQAPDFPIKSAVNVPRTFPSTPNTTPTSAANYQLVNTPLRAALPVAISANQSPGAQPTTGPATQAPGVVSPSALNLAGEANQATTAQQATGPAQSPTAPGQSPPAPTAPAPTAPGQSAEAIRAGDPNDLLSSNQLTLADVVASIVQSFPVIEQARLQGGVAGGDRLAAEGFYDHKLQGYSLANPTGVYRNYRQGIGVARQLWWGGYLSAGYRLGRGDFEPWYKERETDKSGEYKLGLVQPLLQGRAIDPARVALFQANLRQQAVGPEVDRLLLLTALEGSEFYWAWVAIGGALAAQRELLQLAEVRTRQLEDLVKEGKNKGVDLIFNEQLVAERRLKVIETEQKYRETGFKLSLYLRDEAGLPLVPVDEWLPRRFPRIDVFPPGDFNSDLATALSRRPELRLINLELQQVTWDNRLARNQLLPQLDMITEGSQDAGDPASSSNDKSRFELEVGLQGEVPIQRRKARGKIQSTSAKLAQLQQKIRWQENKIGAELQIARNALDQAAQGVQQAEAALRSAITTLDRYNFAFSQGQVDLVFLNLLESKVTEYEIKLIESQNLWFIALARMQAALGLDPIEQAIRVSTLPPSKIPTPGDLPEPVKE